MTESAPQTLHELAPDIWVRNDPLKLLGMELGHRMTAVRLKSGAMWVHSPVRFDEALHAELQALGDIEQLVAPSLMHDLYLGKWLRGLDGARSFAPPGITRKHEHWIITDDLLDPEVPGTGDPELPGWADELPFIELQGMPRIREHLFLHRASKTLIVTDLLFNLTGPQNFLPGLLMKAVGARGGVRTDLPFRLMIRDRNAFRASLARVLEWEFERIVVGHGEVIGPEQIPAVRGHLASL